MYMIFCGGTSFLYVAYIWTLNSEDSMSSDDAEPMRCGNITASHLLDIPFEFTYSQARRVNLNRNIWLFSRPAMTNSERSTMRSLLILFVNFAALHNYTYFMTSGTLLGSYRHHGIMPWDDDVDLLMTKNQAYEIANRLRSLAGRVPAFRDLVVRWGPSKRLKIYHRTSYVPVKVQNFRFGWPCLDITFYDEDSTHLWQYNRLHVLPKSLVFPLTQRPFEMIYLASPRDPFAVLKLLYKNPRCVTLSYSHKLERSKRGFSFDCRDLSEIYPFVFRRIANETVFESVKIGKCTFYEVEVTDPINSAGKPFLLTKL